MKVGERYNYNKGEIFFEKIEEKNESNYKSIIGHFKIVDHREVIINLKPELTSL